MSEHTVTAAARRTQFLFHDFNMPEVRGRFHVLVPAGADIRVGDTVIFGADDGTMRGTVRTLVAYVEPEPGSWQDGDDPRT